MEQPNGPIIISTKGVKKQEGIVAISLPGAGNGYRVNPCEGYGATVENGKDYKFTVSFVDGFTAGEDFVVKVNNVEVPYKIVDRRAGDIAACYADPTKAYEELGWKATRGIEEMCRDSYNFILEQRKDK